jgi:hypothetical protein
MKCGGNVHDKGAVEITASSVANKYREPQNAADLETDLPFLSDNKPDQWIFRDFKVLRIDPTHSTIGTCGAWSNWEHLKSWAVEGSDGGASSTEINRRENNNDLNTPLAMKTFVVTRSGSFRRICLCQTDSNYRGNNYVVLNAFEVFGAVTELH